MSDDIVITGMGIFSPIGCGEKLFWESLCTGRSGAGPVDGLDTSELSRKVACQVRDPVSVDRSMGRASQLAVAAAREAVATAGLSLSRVSAPRVSIIVGTTMGETEFIEERLGSPSDEWLSADHARKIVGACPGCLARNVAADLGVPQGGPPRGTTQGSSRFRAVDLYGACAAGNMAITAARRQLLDGRCDVALAGGADGFSRLAFIGFMRLRVMAAEVCRPFDERRDGLLVGEGGVMFVLERESSAKARGAPIRARVVGAAVACENYHPTRPHPEGDGLSRATMEALRDAGLTPGDIDYVCAHGTGTPQNDAIEVAVMQRCFPHGVAFSSIKALTGHPMGAAAAMEAAACILSLEQQTLIPTWHLDKVLQPCALDAVQGAVRRTRVRYVLNNSAGFGGYNSSIVLAAA
jgi:3-oxoacyl-[acyl-carrier-protein] synthase II